MLWEHQLRRLSVGQRIAAIIALLLLPMGALSLVSVTLLNEQEIAFRESVEESIHTLLPLTTLEHYLQRALVDELEAQSNESVPDFGALTENIDRTFARIEGSNQGLGLDGEVSSAQQAWHSARPSVQRLIEQVRTLRPGSDDSADATSRRELQLAIRDISLARQQLAHAVEARYGRAIAARHSQLRWLVASWAITLSIAALLMFALLYSLLSPIKALGRAARRLGAGELGVRVPVSGSDELTALAERFNEMAAYWEVTRQTLLTEAAEDPLTGVLNRRAILASLEAELATHARQAQPLSIFMMDLDRFKAINDHFGHSAGDRALIWVATRIGEMLRDGDRLGRYGGDEFLAILPHTGAEQAHAIAARINQAIGEAAAREAAYPGLSIGVASAPDQGTDAAALIEAADRSLYQGKERRRRAS